MGVLFIGVGDAGCMVVDKLWAQQSEGMKFMKVCDREAWLEGHDMGDDCPTVSLLDPELPGVAPGTDAAFFAQRAMLHADEIREKILTALAEKGENKEMRN